MPMSKPTSRCRELRISQRETAHRPLSKSARFGKDTASRGVGDAAAMLHDLPVRY